MADLSDVQAAGSTKIIGSDASGVEQTPVNSTAQGALYVSRRDSTGAEIGTVANPEGVKISDGTHTAAVDANGNLKVSDGVKDGGVYGRVSIPTANVAVEMKVGASRLSNRKFLQVVTNNAGLFWGLDSSVTTTSGVPLANGQVLTFSIDPDSSFSVWLVGNANTKTVQVVECP